MPRIQPNNTPDAKSGALLEGVRAMLGTTPNIFTTLAHSPAALGVFVGAIGAMGDSGLSGALREQIAVAVSAANGCVYCASAHTALGAMNKVSQEELKLNLHGKSADSKTQAALTFALQIVKLHGHVADADVTAVRKAGYTDGEIADIVAVTGVTIFTNYFNEVAGTEVDFPLVEIAPREKSCCAMKTA